MIREGGRVLQRPDKVAIVGVGLIGGSVGLAIRSRNAANQVVGVDLDPISRLDLALTAGAIDVAVGRPRRLESLEADLIVICAPVTATVPLVIEASRFCPESALITDVGSTKGRIVAEVGSRPGNPESRFVGKPPDRRLGAPGGRAFPGRPVRRSDLRVDADRPNRARPAPTSPRPLGQPRRESPRDRPEAA